MVKTPVPDTPLPGFEGYVRHGCDRHPRECPPECDHIDSYGPQFRLYESSLGLRRVAELCAARLAELLEIPADAVRVKYLTNAAAVGDVIGLSLILDADSSPYGYHRVSYDSLRQWTYCADPKRRDPWDPSCAFPLPSAPPYEVIEAAAETVTYTARWRGKKGGRVGYSVPAEETVICLRTEAAEVAEVAEPAHV